MHYRFVVTIVLISTSLLATATAAADRSWVVGFYSSHSSTRCYVYSFPTGVDGLTLAKDPALLKVESTLRVFPDIASFAKNVSAIPDYLANFIPTWSVIPANKRESTWFYFRNTNWVNRLPDVDKTAVREAIFNYLSAQNGGRVKVKLSSPTEIATLQWLTLNFALGRLDYTKYTVNDAYGVLYLSPVHTMIAFVPSEAELPLPQFAVTTTVVYGGPEYSLYAATYDTFGPRESLQRIIANQILNAGENTVVETPCYFRGYNETVQGRTIVGTGDWDACKALVVSVVLAQTACPYDSCSFGGNFLPVLRSHFWACDWFTNYGPEVFHLPGNVSLQHLEDVAKNYSTTAWPTVVAEIGSNSLHLFNPLFVVTLLADTYGFSRVRHDQFYFAPDFAGPNNAFELNLALGTVLYDSQLLRTEPIVTTAAASDATTSAVTAVFTVVIALLAVLF